MVLSASKKRREIRSTFLALYSARDNINVLRGDAQIEEEQEGLERLTFEIDSLNVRMVSDRKLIVIKWRGEEYIYSDNHHILSDSVVDSHVSLRLPQTG